MLTRLVPGVAGASRRAAWLFGRRQAQSSCVRPPCRREPPDRSRSLRTAPAGDLRMWAERVLDGRHRPQLPNGCGAQEQPLVCAVPAEYEPPAVGGPGDGAELSGTGKEEPRPCFVRLHKEDLAPQWAADRH